MKTYAGSCLCKGVTFEVTGPLQDFQTCHCIQCRKTSGHYAANVTVSSLQMELLRYDSLKWFTSMDQVEKGFCSDCGSSLFWSFAGRDGWNVAAGVFDDQLDAKISHHSFTAEKSDYYTLDDGLPQAPLFDLEVSVKPSFYPKPKPTHKTDNEQ